MRTLWFGFGLLTFVVALVGIVLPLLPTTPFLLLSAFAFSRSSPRVEAWLVGHPRFGPPIRDWRSSGAIARRNKAIAVAAMGFTVLLAWLSGVGTSVLVLQCVVLVPVAAFVLSRPEPPAPADSDP